MSLKVLLVLCVAGVALASYHHEEHHHHPQPYHFGYEIKDHKGSQHRHESGDGHGNVQGSYGYVDHKGIHREVHYVADHGGFRAQIKTNEPGTANQDSAHVKIQAHPTYHHYEPKHHHHHEQQHHQHHEQHHYRHHEPLHYQVYHHQQHHEPHHHQQHHEPHHHQPKHHYQHY